MSLTVCLAALLGLVPPTDPGPAQAQAQVQAQVQAQGQGSEVDLALVLAVDVSLSMTPEEQAVQRGGYVAAFRSGEVQRAIGQGLIGRIAVTYVEWAGSTSQVVVVPWTVIGTPQDAEGFADRLARVPPRRSTWTSIAGALDASVGLLREGGFEAARRVVDVSGDGPNNQGREVTRARDDAVAAGVVINGLPLMIRAPTGAYDIPDLDLYYRDCVIGGPGAFMLPVREAAEFTRAIRTEIVREVSEGVPAAARVWPVQSPRQEPMQGLIQEPIQGPERAFTPARCAAAGLGSYGLDR